MKGTDERFSGFSIFIRVPEGPNGGGQSSSLSAPDASSVAPVDATPSTRRPQPSKRYPGTGSPLEVIPAEKDEERKEEAKLLQIPTGFPAGLSALWPHNPARSVTRSRNRAAAIRSQNRHIQRVGRYRALDRAARAGDNRTLLRRFSRELPEIRIKGGFVFAHRICRHWR